MLYEYVTEIIYRDVHPVECYKFGIDFRFSANGIQ